MCPEKLNLLNDRRVMNGILATFTMHPSLLLLHSTSCKLSLNIVYIFKWA